MVIFLFFYCDGGIVTINSLVKIIAGSRDVYTAPASACPAADAVRIGTGDFPLLNKKQQEKTSPAGAKKKGDRKHQGDP